MALNDKLAELKKQIDEIKDFKLKLDTKIKSSNEFIQNVNDKVNSITDNLTQLKDCFSKYKKSCLEFKNNVTELNQKLKNNEDEIKRLNELLNSTGKQINGKLEEQIQTLTEENNKLKTDIGDATAAISEYSNSISEAISYYKDAINTIPSDNINLINQLSTMQTNVKTMLQECLSFVEDGSQSVSSGTAPATSLQPGIKDSSSQSVIDSSTTATGATSTGTILNSAKNDYTFNNVLIRFDDFITKLKSTNFNQTIINELITLQKQHRYDQVQNLLNKIKYNSDTNTYTYLKKKGGRKTQRKRKSIHRRRKTHRKYRGGWKYSKKSSVRSKRRRTR